MKYYIIGICVCVLFSFIVAVITISLYTIPHENKIYQDGYKHGYSHVVDSVRARQSELFQEDSTILIQYLKSKK